jgi:serine/threonine protein kinase
MEALGLKVVKLIREGSFASVFLAEKSDGTTVAVKRVSKAKQTMAELQFEAAAMYSSRHENVVKLLYTADSEEYFYYVLEYCDADLFDIITVGVEINIREWFVSLARVVGHCHSKGVYHRDLKPENVLLKDNRVVLADFGLASTDKYSDQFRVGSTRYMSPEVFAKDGLAYSCAANDVWALGVILINMVTSKSPWKEPCLSSKCFRQFRRSPEEYLSLHFDFSNEMIRLLKKVFSINPKQRPSAVELANMVAAMPRFLNSDPLSPLFMDRTPKKVIVKQNQPSLMSSSGSDPDYEPFKSKLSLGVARFSKLISSNFFPSLPSR